MRERSPPGQNVAPAGSGIQRLASRPGGGIVLNVGAIPDSGIRSAGMKRIAWGLCFTLMAVRTAHASCKSEASDGLLAGAALISFMTHANATPGPGATRPRS